MFELMLMRHAKSDWHSDKADFDRPLNQRGRQDASRIGRHLKQLNIIPDVIVSSAAKRTRQTAELVNDYLALDDSSMKFDKELYLAGNESLRNIIEEYASDGMRLMVIAHNPGMDDLVSYLANTALPLSSNDKLMSTAAVAGFQIPTLDCLTSPGMAEMKYIFRPKEL